MYNNEYDRGYRAGSQSALNDFLAEKEFKRKQEQSNRWKNEIGSMDWNAIGSERLRRLKASKYEEMFPKADHTQKIYTMIIIGIILFLFFKWLF